MIVPGKEADLVVLDANPAARIADIRKVKLVSTTAVPYDPPSTMPPLELRLTCNRREVGY